MDKMIEKVARAIFDEEYSDGRPWPMVEPPWGVCIKAARAAISAYNPDDRLREALERVFSVTDLYRDVFGSECLAKLDEARSALSPLPHGDT